ncbi:MAG: ribosome maturation factor RimM [Myxococcota bacterium]
MERDELDIGYVAGAHGVHGNVRIKLHDPKSQALRAGATVTLAREHARVEHTIESVEVVPGKAGLHRVRLHDVRGRDAAEALKGSTVVMPRQALPALAEDEFYLADALGLTVMRQAEPRCLGTVVGLTSNNVQDLFEVEWIDDEDRKHRWLMPVIAGMVLDVDRTRVLVELPEGFLPEALELPS